MSVTDPFIVIYFWKTVGRERECCNKCPSCIQIRNNETYEATPLLIRAKSPAWDTKCYDRSLVAVFIMLLIFGTGVGVYLLLLQSEYPNSVLFITIHNLSGLEILQCFYRYVTLEISGLDKAGKTWFCQCAKTNVTSFDS